MPGTEFKFDVEVRCALQSLITKYVGSEQQLISVLSKQFKPKLDRFINVNKEYVSLLLYVLGTLNQGDHSLDNLSQSAINSSEILDRILQSGSTSESTVPMNLFTDYSLSDVDYLYLLTENALEIVGLINKTTKLQYVFNSKMPAYLRILRTDSGHTSILSSHQFKELFDPTVIRRDDPFPLKCLKEDIQIRMGPKSEYNTRIDTAVPVFSKHIKKSPGDVMETPGDAIQVIPVPAAETELIFKKWSERQQVQDLFTHHEISKVISSQCFLVPKGIDASDQEHWRLSFSIAERRVISTLGNNYRLIYTFAKSMKQRCSDIPSYLLKTSLFWMCEQIPKSHWVPKNVLDLIFILLQKTFLCITRGNLPHYFIPEQNLLDVYSRVQLNVYRMQASRWKDLTKEVIENEFQINSLSEARISVMDILSESMMSAVGMSWETQKILTETYHVYDQDMCSCLMPMLKISINADILRYIKDSYDVAFYPSVIPLSDLADLHTIFATNAALHRHVFDAIKTAVYDVYAFTFDQEFIESQNWCDISLFETLIIMNAYHILLILKLHQKLKVKKQFTTMAQYVRNFIHNIKANTDHCKLGFNELLLLDVLQIHVQQYAALWDSEKEFNGRYSIQNIIVNYEKTITRIKINLSQIEQYSSNFLGLYESNNITEDQYKAVVESLAQEMKTMQMMHIWATVSLANFHIRTLNTKAAEIILAELLESSEDAELQFNNWQLLLFEHSSDIKCYLMSQKSSDIKSYLVALSTLDGCFPVSGDGQSLYQPELSQYCVKVSSHQLGNVMLEAIRKREDKPEEASEKILVYDKRHKYLYELLSVANFATHCMLEHNSDVF